MRQTPWTKKAGSSFPSDRIKPSYASPATENTKKRGANTSKEPPKSKEVRQLESLLTSLRVSAAPQKDPKGGCFCQAREDPLSPYSPICRTCGLILCSLNQPNFSCPHCSSSLLSEAQRSSIITRIETQISDVLAKEAAERERVIEEARREAGAFPALGPAPSGKPSQSQYQPRSMSSKGSNRSTATPSPQPETHKVLSLKGSGKKGKAIISSYTPVASRPASRSESEVENAEDEVTLRVPPPPNQVSFSRERPDPARPWTNLRGCKVRYIPDEKSSGNEESKSRQNKKGKGKGKENQTNAESSAVA
ncbi:hypothetical protein D9758_004997 [Tetrapyrgos nigripes]|uniref:TRIP4/RQT4 C2HC5-type zinc finger domain-containing protein n=1 Tax=Tetrapyrgos nigripes TaxID=182062 RepID=A0A8H5LWR2_9AGAR|nr:hypothetical protein D9758_004997 [Tetrapyrgos nigripes]